MFTEPAYFVMHCSISVLWLSRHALFLSGMRGWTQIGFILSLLPADRYADVISNRESEFNTLITHIIRPPPYSNDSLQVSEFVIRKDLYLEGLVMKAP